LKGGIGVGTFAVSKKINPSEKIKSVSLVQQTNDKKQHSGEGTAMIYMACNKKDGKYYIGQTNQSLSRRTVQHGQHARLGTTSRFFDAIRKDGFDTFEWFMVDAVTDKNGMNQREHELIRAFKADDPRCGYNANLPRFTVTDEQASDAAATAFNLAFAA
jgi:GIY-YIG catalytic domain